MATSDTTLGFHTPHPMRQVGGLFLCAVCVFLLMCLMTYNQADSSLNHASPAPVANLGGYAGAVMADLCLQVLGLSGALLGIIPLIWGSKMLAGREIPFLWARVSLLMLAMILTAATLAGLEAPVMWPITSGLGGAVGALLHDRLNALYHVPLFLPFLAIITAATLCITAGMRWGEWRAVAASVRRGVVGFLAMIVSLRYITRRRYDDEAEEEPISLRERLTRNLKFWSSDEEQESEEEIADAAPEAPKTRVLASTAARREPKISKKAAEPASSRRDSSAANLSLPLDEFTLPDVTLLHAVPRQRRTGMSESALTQNARLLETVLQDFGVQGEITEIRPGPVVTLYELEPAAGTKSSRVIGLADDIARSMSAVSARIAVIPGRNAIGIELPNANRETVFLRELVEADAYTESDCKLPLVLGKEIGGLPIIVDLAKMPHLLVAGTTGSGKSVAINTMIMSLVFHLSPEQCKFIMIDPKMLELSVYDGIPHLLTPVVTEPGKAVVALKWTVKEMEQRYRMMSNAGVRNIEGYNKKIREYKSKGKQLTRDVQTGFDPETGQPIMETVEADMVELPFIVVIVDEMADLMIVAGKDIESSIQRLAQMARAAGIHIIMATQRPSVDVITGVIKANFPTRISFQVTSKIDSRTILGEQGAEQLLGQGDMLYMAGGGRITRIHGPFVSDREVESVVAHLKEQGVPEYIDDVTRSDDEQAAPGEEGERDELYDEAVAIVSRDRKASTSYIQRCLKIGYNRAATIIERMEREGIVGPANHVGKREVLTRESA